MARNRRRGCRRVGKWRHLVFVRGGVDTRERVVRRAEQRRRIVRAVVAPVLAVVVRGRRALESLGQGQRREAPRERAA
jgi:hypothetical protein